jgi:hypothetical protein
MSTDPPHRVVTSWNEQARESMVFIGVSGGLFNLAGTRWDELKRAVTRVSSTFTRLKS